MSRRRVAVVTGAAGSIGHRVLDLLASQGYDVYGLDRRTGTDPRVSACDLTDDDAVRDWFGDLGRTVGRIDVLVLSAALSAVGSLSDHDVSVHRQVMEVTHFGALSCLLAARPWLKAAGGRVVLIGSVAGFAPVLGRPAYVAAKHAVVGLFGALRPELHADGINLTIVHPTFVVGGMSEAAPRSGSGARATSGEELTPDEVARAIVRGIDQGRDLVLVGRTARASYLLSRHTPRLYATLMNRRLGRPEGGPS